MPSASLWAYSEENLSFVCSSEKPAGFSELLFHRKGRNLQLLFFFADLSVKKAIPDRPQSVRYCSNQKVLPLKMPRAKRRAFQIVRRSLSSRRSASTAAMPSAGWRCATAPWSAGSASITNRFRAMENRRKRVSRNSSWYFPNRKTLSVRADALTERVLFTLRC